MIDKDRARAAKREIALGALRAVWKLGKLEASQGQLGKTLRLMSRRRGPVFARDWTFAELLEHAAREHGGKTGLEYGAVRFSFEEQNRRANRVARQLQGRGVGQGTGVALMLSNHPRFLDAFFAVQKLGGYAVPVNTALVGDGLQYILGHSESSVAICDHETAERVAALRDRLPKLAHVWVNEAEAPVGWTRPLGMASFDELDAATADDGVDLGITPPADAPSLLLYTSGTTGLPKAVVSAYGNQRVKAIGLLSNVLYKADDKLYTCLPLFHANALLLSVMQSLWVGIPLFLSKRFSASRFWQEVAQCGATQFNTVGGMIPILLKTAPGPFDRAHRVRRVVSAACPKDAWVPFEQRFGVTLWEAYGAVDGAGVTIINNGNAPIGSLGRPGKMVKWRLVREDGSDAGVAQPGELWVFVGHERDGKVPYWKNDRASNEKVVDGWLHTGDLMQRDADGYLYFVGRNTDSMRRRGENVSAYEVEKAVDSHPLVLESAAYGVPSPMGEQDIMIAVVPVEGATLDPKELYGFLSSRLPRFALPSHMDVVDSLPKTGTHRVIKHALKERGVTARTIPLGNWA